MPADEAVVAAEVFLLGAVVEGAVPPSVLPDSLPDLGVPGWLEEEDVALKNKFKWNYQEFSGFKDSKAELD